MADHEKAQWAEGAGPSAGDTVGAGRAEGPLNAEAPLTGLSLVRGPKQSELHLWLRALRLLAEDGRPAMAAEMKRLVASGVPRLAAIDRFMRRFELPPQAGGKTGDPKKNRPTIAAREAPGGQASARCRYERRPGHLDEP